MSYEILIIEKRQGLFCEGLTAIVKIGQQHYLFDLRDTYDHGPECMAFRCNATGYVPIWRDVYCRTGLPVSTRDIRKCIQEFAGELENEQT